ncbi:MAG: hydrolase 1, exosortase A system-associated [Pseudomonadales bacterium]|nr:hydrolase 1, exosortase A system-associated [Pseudomonadales bacterium]
MSKSIERPIVFESQGNQLLGVLHLPEKPVTRTGLLLAVGGPQTRTGSHRQFILLARFLAENGVAVFRFDYTGMGDSQGDKSDFLQACPDVDQALKTFKANTEIDDVCFWGLCDAVSLGLMYLSIGNNQDITKFIAANPWVRQSHTEAKAYLKSYYLSRILDKQFWLKVVRLQFDFLGSLKSLLSFVKQAVSKPEHSGSSNFSSSPTENTWPTFTEGNYVPAMLAGLEKMRGEFHLILSGNDLTADEFRIMTQSDARWSSVLADKTVSKCNVAKATHTFSSGAWRDEVAEYTLKVVMGHSS